MYEDFLAERLTQLRNKKNVSARDMSLSIGQSVNYINSIENKKTLPSITGFFYICEYLGVTPKDFFDVDNENPEILDEVVTDLKKLDTTSLEQVAGIIKKLAEK